MIIKKLEIHGFKSFSERTKLLFHPGITAIIGPNGTGKSNIADALLWVLKGGRLKGLRGDRSDDVIFNGSAKNAPLSLADVTLVLGEESDGSKNDIIINHRVFRSGENEYRLNGKAARLKDIHDTLWKHAIGETEYFVIEQGAIGSFLNSKPMEKRLLLEEAAGTAFYKEKKRQAHNKLENSELNLTRLEDIIIEVEKAVNSLKRQASAAVRYRNLRESARELTLALYQGKIENLEKGQIETARAYHESLEKENRLISRIKTEEKELAGKRKQAWSAEQTNKEEQERLYALKSQFARMEAEQDREEKRKEYFLDKKRTAEKILIELKQEIEVIEKEQSDTLSRTQGLEKQLAEKKQILENARQLEASSQEDLKAQQDAITKIREEYYRFISEQTEIKNDAAKKEKEIELMVRQEVKIRSELDNEQIRVKQITQELSDSEAALKNLEAGIHKKDRQLTQLKDTRDALAEDLSDRESQWDNLRKQRDRGEHQLHALEKMKSQHRNAAGAAALPCMQGLLAEKIETSDEYTKLVDAFYKDQADAGIIHTGDFLKLLEKSSLKGKFLLLHPDKDRSPSSQVDKDRRILGMLKSHVRVDGAIKHHIHPLADAVIVGTLQDAIELWIENPSLHFVTLKGDVLQSSGLIELGDKKEGLIALNQEIKSLGTKIKSLDEEITPITADIEKKKGRQREIQAQIESLTAELAEDERTRASSQKEKEYLETEISRLTTSRSMIEKELDNLKQEKSKIKDGLETVKSALLSLEKNTQENKEKLHAAENSLQELQSKTEQTRRNFFENKSAIDLTGEKINGLKQHHQNLERRKEKSSTKMVTLGAEIRDSEAEINGQKLKIAGLLTKISEMEKDLQVKQNALLKKETALSGLEKEQETLEKGLDELRNRGDMIKDERVKWEVRKAEKERDMVNLEESCWQELKKTLEEAKKEPSPHELTLEQVERELENTREQLQRFKAVNLMAEEEYQIQKKRFDFLSKEREDLLESISSTREAIRKIDQESKVQFLKALTAVNSNFQDIFATLFQGGNAQVKLSDEDSPLESGVEIIAQPPGKKVQSLALLSGGEKSLTSLAFFFALFRYKPAPFCLLDEVDAALDEVNLVRFLNLMKMIKDQTQFIIITHNFKTMEVADYIYGTTMAEPNITSVYSVKMKEKQAVTENTP